MPVWVSWILSRAVPFILGLFGYAPKGSTGPTADEKVGKLEAQNEGLTNYIEVADKASAARDRVVDDPRVVFDDPDNRREK